MSGPNVDVHVYGIKAAAPKVQYGNTGSYQQYSISFQCTNDEFKNMMGRKEVQHYTTVKKEEDAFNKIHARALQAEQESPDRSADEGTVTDDVTHLNIHWSESSTPAAKRPRKAAEAAIKQIRNMQKQDSIGDDADTDPNYVGPPLDAALIQYCNVMVGNRTGIYEGPGANPGTCKVMLPKFEKVVEDRYLRLWDRKNTSKPLDEQFEGGGKLLPLHYRFKKAIVKNEGKGKDLSLPEYYLAEIMNRKLEGSRKSAGRVIVPYGERVTVQQKDVHVAEETEKRESLTSFLREQRKTLSSPSTSLQPPAAAAAAPAPTKDADSEDDQPPILRKRKRDATLAFADLALR